MLAAALAAPAAARTAAEEVAELSTHACFRLAAGEITLPHPATPEFGEAVRALSLEPHINRGILDRLGPAVNLVARSAMAHRSSGDATLVLTTSGALPGCRVLLVGSPPVGAADVIASSLETPALGWTAIPDLTETRGPATKRVFLRRDDRGQAYILNLVELNGVPGEMRLYTTTVRVPPNVQLPEGF